MVTIDAELGKFQYFTISLSPVTTEGYLETWSPAKVTQCNECAITHDKYCDCSLSIENILVLQVDILFL